MLDYLIKGGMVVDGSGGAPYAADVGIRGDRIVSVGDIDESARTTRDADGLLVTPGFIDPHTHYDAQLHWDPAATPSSLHGVTTVIGGNCGFTLAPVKGEDTLYTQRMMARVEGMPLEALQQGPSWNWRSFGEFLDALEGRIAVNAAFLVGHCALRRHVLGDAAVERPSTDDEVRQIAALLEESIQQGGIGLSLSRSYTHTDGDMRPVPSRLAAPDEVFALCDVVARTPATALEAITDGCIKSFDDEGVEFMAQISARARRPVNWNLLNISAATADRVRNQLRPAARARDIGGRVVALSMPVSSDMCHSLGSYCIWWMAPGWEEILKLPLAEKRARLFDADVRARLIGAARGSDAGVGAAAANMGAYRFGETRALANVGLEGRIVADVAEERGLDPFTCVVYVAAEEGFDLDFWPIRPGDSAEDRALKARLWETQDVLLGGSDAGAHIDHLAGSSYPVRFLADSLRGSQLVTAQQAVRLMTDVPARLFGLRDRGRIAPGYLADVLVVDPGTVGSGPARRTYDMPGGAFRLTSTPVGVERVLVNGVEIVSECQLTGATSGTVIRAGRDTDAVVT